MQVGPSEQQLQQEHNERAIEQTENAFRESLASLTREELLEQCVELHAETGVLKSEILRLRGRLTELAVRAEEEDERNVLRLSREISRKNQQLAELSRSP